MVIKRLLRFFSLSGSQTMFLIHFPFWFFLKLRMDSTSPFLFGPSDVAVCRLHLESGSSEDSKSSMIMYFRFAERLNFNALETVFFALDNPVTLFSEVSTLCSLLSSLEKRTSTISAKLSYFWLQVEPIPLQDDIAFL